VFLLCIQGLKIGRVALLLGEGLNKLDQMILEKNRENSHQIKNKQRGLQYYIIYCPQTVIKVIKKK